MLNYKTPTQVGDDYLLTLKGLKPEVNIDQQDSDWYIRSRVVGGVMSGGYADQQKVGGDIFPQTARTDALSRHLETYGLDPIRQPTNANGSAAVTGANGTVYTVGTQFEHEPTGNLYSVSEELILSGPTGVVNLQSIATGQDQNLFSDTPLTLPSPPAGAQPNAVVIEMADGRDLESNAAAAQRVLDRIQEPIQGGNEDDYRQWAVAADPSVTGAQVLRYAFGLGTVAVYITSGTTDIDKAIDNNEAIVRVPSQHLIDTVLDYLYERVPETDCVSVFGAVEIAQDVTIRVAYRSGLVGSDILAGQTLMLNELVEREVKRAIYKVPVGGRKIGATGFLLASEIEEVVDQGLGDSPYTAGSFAEILIDRQVDDLSATGANRMLLANEIVIPGNIIIVEA